MQITDRPHDGTAIRKRAESLPCIRIDINGAPALHRVNGDFRRGGGINWRGVFDCRTGNRCKRGGDDLGWKRSRSVLYCFDTLDIGVDDVVQFILEQIKRAGDSKRYHERQDEKTSIKVPAPDGAVKAGGRRLRTRALPFERSGNGHGCLREIRMVRPFPAGWFIRQICREMGGARARDSLLGGEGGSAASAGRTAICAFGMMSAGRSSGVTGRAAVESEARRQSAPQQLLASLEAGFSLPVAPSGEWVEQITSPAARAAAAMLPLAAPFTRPCNRNSKSASVAMAPAELRSCMILRINLMACEVPYSSSDVTATKVIPGYRREAAQSSAS